VSDTSVIPGFFQNRNVITVITAQKATDISAANIASANRPRAPRQRQYVT
jgi:hypothetical protein